MGASAYQEPECSQGFSPELQHRGIHHWTPNGCGPEGHREKAVAVGAQVYRAVCMYLYMSCKYMGVGVAGCVCISRYVH